MASPAAAATALAANLLLHPGVVRAVVAYWVQHTTPLPTLPARLVPAAATAAPEADTGAAASDALTRLVARLVTERPFELVLRGQHTLEPTAGAPTVKGIYLVHAWPPMDDWQLAVPDYLLAAAGAGGRAVLAALHVMASAPDAHWARVTDGGMRGHVLADTFRHGAALGAVYHPELWVTHVVAALLDALVAVLPVDLLATDGPGVVHALAAVLRDALRPSAGGGGAVLERLARVLGDCTDDVPATHAQVTQLRANLDALAWRAYRQTAAAAERAAIHS